MRFLIFKFSLLLSLCYEMITFSDVITSVTNIVSCEYRDRNHSKYFMCVGDSGYPLEPWLMTPLPHEVEGTPRFQYNSTLCSARNCVERMFGVLKSTWRCLSRHRVLQYEPGFAGRVVNACAVLHNMRIAGGMLDADQIEEIVYVEPALAIDNEDHDLVPDNAVRPLAVARRIQDRLIAEKFGR